MGQKAIFIFLYKQFLYFPLNSEIINNKITDIFSFKNTPFEEILVDFSFFEMNEQ